MSFCVASYFTCSPKASSASATSASSPIEGAARSYRCASLLSMRFPRKPKRKHRPILQRTCCGVVRTAADRWPSSNGSQRHKSNSVLRRYRPPLHELTRPHIAPSARCRASCRSVSQFQPDIFFLSVHWLTAVIHSSLLNYADSSSTGLDHAVQLLHTSLAAFNLHKSRVTRPQLESVR